MSPKDALSSSQVDAKISEFETKLDQLYRRYEQYFIGVDDRPPRQPRRQVARLFREIEQLPKIKTSLKFRFRSLVQRFNSYKVYWNRTERQIEEGTYHRDLARAKARQKRRQPSAQTSDEPADAAKASDDGAFEIDDADLADLDLASMEQELQDMDERGEFEKHVSTKKMRANNPGADGPRRRDGGAADGRESGGRESGGWQRPDVDDNVKRKKLAELQEKLGLSTRKQADASPAGGGRGFSRSGEGPTQKARPENPSAPSRGADMSKLRKLRRAKDRLDGQASQRRVERPGAADKPTPAGAQDKPTTGANRVIERRSSSGSSRSASASSSAGSTDESSRKIYDNLVEAKRRCKEDVSNLNYDSFKRSMERQRTQIQKNKGARNVDFKVVIKKGSAFLKPDTD